MIGALAGGIGSLIGPAIGGIGSLIGGLVGSNAAGNAGAVLQQAGQTAATNITNAGNTAVSGLTPAVSGAQQQGQNALASISPYQSAGATGLSSLAQLLGPTGGITKSLTTPFSFNPGNLQNTPGYQFQLAQGTQAIQNQASAQGLTNSGATMKGLSNYATGLAGTYYQNAYNNALNTYQTNRQNSLYQLSALSGLANIGQNANSQALQANEYIGNAGLQGATQAGNWTIGAQQAAMGAYMQGQEGAAAGIMGQGNAWQNAIGGIGNAFSNAYSMSQLPNYSSGYSYNSPGTFSGTGTQMDNSGNFYDPSNPNNFLVGGG